MFSVFQQESTFESFRLDWLNCRKLVCIATSAGILCSSLRWEFLILPGSPWWWPRKVDRCTLTETSAVSKLGRNRSASQPKRKGTWKRSYISTLSRIERTKLTDRPRATYCPRKLSPPLFIARTDRRGTRALRRARASLQDVIARSALSMTIILHVVNQNRSKGRLSYENTVSRFFRNLVAEARLENDDPVTFREDEVSRDCKIKAKLNLSAWKFHFVNNREITLILLLSCLKFFDLWFFVYCFYYLCNYVQLHLTLISSIYLFEISYIYIYMYILIDRNQ